MTRTEMEQLKRIPDEIKAIEESLKNPRMEYVNVYYKDYRTGKGIPKSRSEYDYDHQEWYRLKKKLRQKIEKLSRLIIEAELFIANIEDSETRTILRMYYINGKSQDEIGEALHYSQAAISNKINTFWSKAMSNKTNNGKAI